MNMNQDVKILIVDDDLDVLELTSRIMELEGYSVFKASSGKQCLEIAMQIQPHLILLDVNLGDADGSEICQKIKLDPVLNHTFILLLSGMRTASHEQAAGLDSGADGYLTKPVKRDELVARVNAMVRILKSEQELREREKQLNVALEEKKILLQELYHRTKNNMQMIISMINLQAQNIDNDEFKQIFKNTNARIETMALVHEKLYQSNNLSEIDLKDYIGDLTGLIMSSYHEISKGIEINMDLDHVMVSIESAIPCGLIINELILNSLQHAFPGNQKGQINIRLKQSTEIEIHISDNGVGLPSKFDVRSVDSFGLLSVITLAESQLDGAFQFNSEKGVTCSIHFTDQKK